MSEKKNSKSKFITILSKVALQVGLFLAPLAILLILLIIGEILDIIEFDGGIFFLCPSLFYVVHVWIDECEKIKSKDIFFKLYFYVLLFAGLFFNFINLRWYDSFPDKLPYHLIIYLPLLVYVIVRKLKKKKIYWQSWISIPIFFVSILSGRIEIFTTIYVSTFIIYIIYESYVNQDLIEMDCGIIANFALIYIGLIVFKGHNHHIEDIEHIVHIVLGGILFILLVITNIYLYRKRRRASAEKPHATIQD